MTTDSPAPTEDSQPLAEAQTDQPSPSAVETGSANEAAPAPATAPDAPAAEPTAQPEATSPVESGRPKIQVGSRRPGAPGDIKSTKPLVARKDQPIADEVAAAAAAAADSLPKTIEASLPIEEVAPTRANIPTPSRRDPLSAEMEAEFLETMASVELDTVVDAEATVRASQELELESRVLAPVMRIEGDNVFFGLTGRNEGFTSVRNFKEPPAVGESLDIVLKKFNAEDGLYEVAVRGAAINVADWSDLEEGAVVDAVVSAVNTGGLECTVNNIRAFMPASQVAMFRVEDFSEYLGRKMQCIVMEANERKRNLVLSHRALLERDREESRRKLLEEISAGDLREGVVSNVKDFGCFVDLGGVDGMIHISQLSWERIKHPSEVVEVGQKIKVKVEKINAETGKISLSYRDLLDHPWDGIEAKLPLGTIVTGAVTRIAKFGAFVRVAPGVEGLIHISELAHQRVRAVSDIVKEGDDVSVKIMSVDREGQKIGLSLKATVEAPASAAKEEEDEAPRELAVAKRKGPLKGGMDRPSGGESFGLNW